MSHFSCIIGTVVVESNILRAVTHAFALSFNSRVSTEGSCNGFFIVLSTSAVLHTLISTCIGGVEVKTGLCTPHMTLPSLSVRDWNKLQGHGDNKTCSDRNRCVMRVLGLLNRATLGRGRDKALTLGDAIVFF
jgi:hypothetical protein